MKFGSFSDAIRVGAKLRPQTFEALYRFGMTCAIGAGLDALGHDAKEITGVDASPQTRAILTPLYPYLYEPTESKCPACGSALSNLQEGVMQLNDDHRWSRERIADWLQSEEDKLGYITITESIESESLVTLATLGVG